MSQLLISEDYPYLEVQFAVRDYETQVRAYLDTGFDGYLIVPLPLATNLGREDYATQWELGDGSLIEAKEYFGAIEIPGLETSLPARITSLGDGFLIGRSVIDRFRVIFNHGQRIEIEQ